MVGRVTTNTLQHTFNRLKSHVVGAYQQGRHWAGMLDSAIQVGRRAYGVARPLLDQSATGKRVSGVANSALMNYSHPPINQSTSVRNVGGKFFKTMFSNNAELAERRELGQTRHP